ncbi:hypothetical protein D3C78_1710410 [compost metagenome]
MLRQSGIEAHGLAQVGSHVELHQRPDAIDEIWIVQVDLDVLCLRQFIAIRNQAFKVQRQGFAHVLQCLGKGFAAGVAAAHVRHDHAIVGVRVFVYHDRKFHLFLPLVNLLSGVS